MKQLRTKALLPALPFRLAFAVFCIIPWRFSGASFVQLMQNARIHKSRAF